MPRVIWIILDSVGIGECEDSDKFGDKGADTLGHIYEYMNSKGNYRLPNMEKMGLGNIDGVNSNINKVDEPIGIYCKARELSNGKDTTIGHWEMCGVITKEPFPTYPNGFSEDIIERFVDECGIPGVLGNKVASGTEILEELGAEHLITRKPIVYTSADSVFQIACHEEVYSNEELYDMCEKARKILMGKDAVARVIARPFEGTEHNFNRTAGRRDYSLKPSENNLLEVLTKNNIKVYAVGKIEDIFAGSGIFEAVHTKDNMEGIDKTIEYMNSVDEGLIYTNLVEFDSKWGHRRDTLSYAKGLKEFDDRLVEIINEMKDDDVLIINSDHGCDPTFKGTDHTREFIPVLIYGNNIQPANKHIINGFADIGQTVADLFEVDILEGVSII